MKNSQTMVSRVFTVITVVALVFALNVSGALAGFWRTLDGITANGVPNPADFLYGIGTNGENYGIYGYGYGYGYGDFDAGIPSIEADAGSGGGGIVPPTTTTGGGGGGGSSKDNCPDGDLSGSRYDKTCLAVNSEYNETEEEYTETEEETTTETPNDAVSGTDEEDTIRNEGNCEFPGLSPNYTDIDDSWARSYIRDLSKRGIMNGVNTTLLNPGSEFQPERAVTRTEFLKIALRSFCYDYSDLTGTENFADVENGSWVAKVTELAGALGVIDTTNENFRPNDPVSKIEAMKIILRIGETRSTKFMVDETVQITSFIDVNEAWMKKYAAKSEDLGIIDGNAGYFEPTIAITRAQTSKIAVRSMNAQ